MPLKIFNLTHLKCPDTIVCFRKIMRKIHHENIIIIISHDISTTWDIPLFCNFMNYKIIKQKIRNKPYQFWIKK
ncbi:Sulfur carrier protein TusA [Buchnera aphidicola (Pterocallis alni)]|uniref:sulfurtransferase TusA family protein n=1 Tax=Buchnera aphidicola TaxID=9 RepID=UPI0034649F0B